MPSVQMFDAAEVQARRDALAALLQDAVHHGGGVGFLAPLEEAAARAYWADVRDEVASGRRVVLALVEGDAVLGAVQLAPATRSTGLHRADVQKLIVHSTQRRKGFAKRLMEAAEREALARGRTLLCLDTFTGSEGDALYATLGWNKVGEIPRYARRPDGAFGALSLYYKDLARSA